jgi:hypothetical protein
MKNLLPLIAGAILFASCSPSTRNADGVNSTDSVASTTDSTLSTAKPLFATMKISNKINVGDSVKLKFTVYNTADSVQTFCKWHTPFEPLISKYLDIKSESGDEVDYRGAMAKRIMPPPADSYIKVNPGDSLSVNVDLLKGYNISKPGKYAISYNAQNMSGLVVKDSVVFVYAKP